MHALRRGLCSASALRTLGLDRSNANPESLKLKFKELAKKWHPDRHQGASKADAEAKFKELQSAYQLLKQPGALRAAMHEQSGGMAYGAGPSTHAGRRARGAAYQDGRYRRPEEAMWGERYGPASKPGYDPNTTYMGFKGKGKHGHWYEDTAAAAADEDRRRMFRSWGGLLVFALGLGTVYYTGRRDKLAKQRGELVDAWWNNATRRWERPQPYMFKDPFMSSAITLKPPNQVWEPSTKRAPNRKQSVTIDGANARDSYLARAQGHRGMPGGANRPMA